MSKDEEAKVTLNPGYVVEQLRRAISAATEHSDPDVRERAIAKSRRWEQVFQAMLGGSTSFGTRAPVKDVPEWVTLEVLQGGFASGNLTAGGPLQPHEVGLLARLNRRFDETARAAFNIYYLSDDGQSELRSMLASGCYRINVPEEGALLVIAWLLSRGMMGEAQELLDAITPFFDRLRFYPVPDANPIVPSPTVHRHDVEQTATVLREHRPQPHVEQMIEALKVWQPLYDRTVSLFLETVEEDCPCQKYPDGWRVRAQAVLGEYVRLRKVHTLCRKPDRPKENFCRLRGYLKKCVDNPATLTWRDIGMVRSILYSYTERHGVPGSTEFVLRRAEQARIAGFPTHSELAGVLLVRLQQFPEKGGIENIDPVISPVTEQESLQFKIPSGSHIPANLAFKVRRSWSAPVERLTKAGVIPSGEVLAQVLPQITSQVRAAGIADRDLRRLYGAIYSAFRRRRSLLLLNLEHQVQFEDLPWIKVLNSLRKDDLNAREEAHQVFTDVSTVAIVSFPHAILPNKLLQELQTLSSAASLAIPIVDELAADIFMGAFTEKFLSAAKIAAKMLEGSLYERYYSLPYERILQLNDLQKTHGASTSPGFAASCEELAGIRKEEDWSVSRNGRIIEQSQLLTTHNLATLFDALQLRPALSGRLRELAEQCFRWILKRQISRSWKANLRMVKNSAYAWRQMLFFLSLLDTETVWAFVNWAREEAGKQASSFARQLEPALTGLEWIATGGWFDEQGFGGASGQARRFTGWTSGRHWLLASENKDLPAG